MILLIVDSHSAVGGGEEDGVAHLSKPLEWDRGIDMGSVDHGPFVCENPFAAFLVLLDKPYFTTSESFLAHLDELGLHAVEVITLSDTDKVFIVLCSNPGVSILERVDLTRLQLYVKSLVELLSGVEKLKCV